MLTDKDIEKLTEAFYTKKEIDEKFEKIDEKFVETNRHFDIIAEDIKSDIGLLAEQISAKNSKVDAYEEKIENLNSDIAVLKSRVSAVEVKVEK